MTSIVREEMRDLSKEDLLIMLENMSSITSGLTSTERQACSEAIDYILNNDNTKFCQGILDRIEVTGAGLIDIKTYCNNYLASKEEINNG